ncbi:MAG TPA: hypothetical protein VGO35_11055 [Gammaproteobacteria bacterium]|jgi:hypothetical protein|nr:hypothetical protein [Gammaproteobacteria bacterium]
MEYTTDDRKSGVSTVRADIWCVKDKRPATPAQRRIEELPPERCMGLYMLTDPNPGWVSSQLAAALRQRYSDLSGIAMVSPDTKEVEVYFHDVDDMVAGNASDPP